MEKFHFVLFFLLSTAQWNGISHWSNKEIKSGFVAVAKDEDEDMLLIYTTK